MGQRGNLGTWHIQIVDSEERLFFLGHGPAALGPYIRDEQHIRRIRVEFEPFGDTLAENRRRERPEALPIFYFEVQGLLHRWRTRIAENGTPAQCAWAE